MVEETKAHDTNTKTQLSLAAALFFSPLVQNMLNKNTWDITDKDRDFIRWYIKLWYITLLFWIITIATGVMNYLFAINILSIIYTISIVILVFLLVISIVSILSDISLIKWGDYTLQTHTIEGNRKDILLKYIPLYNIYLWYASHSFDTPNWRIKESILLWMVFLLVSMLGNVFLSSVILILIIFRIAALMSDIDFLTTWIKKTLNWLFSKNPEEVLWYATWFLIYLIKSLVHSFVQLQPYTLEAEIQKEKEVYSRIIYVQSNSSIIIEYIVWVILIVWCIFIIKPDFSIRTYYAAFWLLICRYLIMILQLKHLPHLPIAREVFLLGHQIIIRLKKKSFIHN